MQLNNLYIVLGLRIWPGAWLTWAVGRARARYRWRARTDDGHRPAAGGGSGRGRWRASQNRDVTAGSWLTGRTDRRTSKAISPKSGVMACLIQINKEYIMVLASSAHFIRSLVVDEESHWLGSVLYVPFSALSLTVGWQEGQKASNYQGFCFRMWRKKTHGGTT